MSPEMCSVEEADAVRPAEGKISELDRARTLRLLRGRGRLTSLTNSKNGYAHQFRSKKGSKNYIYGVNGNLKAEADASNNITATYIRGGNRLLIKQLADETQYYYLYNGHGDVVQITDRAGNIVNSYEYDEWGNITSQTETIENDFKYAGQTYDSETGLYYLRARYYDPETGRFISEDPIGDGLNWYTYCGNNPVARIDPSGLDSYILYDPHDNGFASYDKAAAMAKELEAIYGTPCHLIAISSGDALIDAWNNQVGFDAKGNEVSIDATAIFAHGSATTYNFKDKKSEFNNLRFYDTDIGKLDQKTMELFISISCNTGYPNGNNPNIATEIMNAQAGIKHTLAADGDVYAPSTTTTTGMWWWKKTTTQVSLYTGSDREGAAGYKLYSRNSNGGIITSNVGGLGYVFNGLTELINMALNK